MCVYVYLLSLSLIERERQRILPNKKKKHTHFRKMLFLLNAWELAVEETKDTIKNGKYILYVTQPG